MTFSSGLRRGRPRRCTIGRRLHEKIRLVGVDSVLFVPELAEAVVAGISSLSGGATAS